MLGGADMVRRKSLQRSGYSDAYISNGYPHHDGLDNQDRDNGGASRRHAEVADRAPGSGSGRKPPLDSYEDIVDESDGNVYRSNSKRKIAGSKRNAEFHKIFNQIPRHEKLLHDWSCALSRDILLQGRLYVTMDHVCFYTNIFGWTTHLVINFREIVSVQRKNTAVVFPNGLVIQTQSERYSFASFVNREFALSVLLELLRLFRERSAQEEVTSLGSEEEEVEDSENLDETDADLSVSGIEVSDTSGYDSMSQTSSRPILHRSPSSGNAAVMLNIADSRRNSSLRISDEDGNHWPVTNLGPESHPATKVPALDSTEKMVLSDVVPAPPGVVANLLLGDDTTWYRTFLLDVEKIRNLDMIPAFQDENGIKTRRYEYVKPLNGPVGPKKTVCKAVDTIIKWDLNDYINCETVTITPDVPSGSSFSTHSRLILAWAENNHTRIQMTTWIHWTGKSWIKGAIEKGAFEGQTTYGRHLVVAIESALKPDNIANNDVVTSRRPKKRQIKPRKHMQTEKVAYTDTTRPPALSLALACLTAILIVFMLSVTFYSRKKESSAHLKRIHDDLLLWQWIDEHAQPERAADIAMSNKDIEEVIRITEMRLEKLKKKLVK